jgi:2,3-diketo-5-methylthiopentyl-1-phosphate enolase
MGAAHKADKEKGEKTLYTVNITDENTRLLDNAYKAIAAGANGIMIDVFGTGFSGLRMLAEDPNINVPICAHTCYGGAQTVSPFQGISTEVAQKLIRLCGADISLNVAPSAKFNALQEKFIRVFQVTHSPMYHIKPMFNMIGGGVTPGMVPYLYRAIGERLHRRRGCWNSWSSDGPQSGSNRLPAGYRCGDEQSRHQGRRQTTS